MLPIRGTFIALVGWLRYKSLIALTIKPSLCLVHKTTIAFATLENFGPSYYGGLEIENWLYKILIAFAMSDLLPSLVICAICDLSYLHYVRLGQLHYMQLVVFAI